MIIISLRQKYNKRNKKVESQSITYIYSEVYEHDLVRIKYKY